MAQEPKPKPQIYVPILALNLAAIVWAGFSSKLTPVNSWYLIILLLATFGAVIAHGLTGSWRGILIDSRNRMSLSRFQFLAWTLIALSGILTIALRNINSGWETPLDFNIPSELWVLMGISTASLVASPAILGTKQEAIKTNPPGGAAWADLFKGEEENNAQSVDLGRMQMFFFTFVLLLTYAAQLRNILWLSEGYITSMPEIPSGMNVLLGISHTGYLAQKSVNPLPPKEK